MTNYLLLLIFIINVFVHISCMHKISPRNIEKFLGHREYVFLFLVVVTLILVNMALPVYMLSAA